MKASVIIRTKNEARRLRETLNALVNQSEKDFEVIIVDSGSNDGTIEIAKQFEKALSLSIYQIPSQLFSYPFASNYGADKAVGDYLVFISGHSIPVNNEWLKSGLSDFDDEKVAGVYGTVLPSADATIIEWFLYLPFVPRTKRIANGNIMGILGKTNAIIRRNLWTDHHFDENYSEGGEDGEWAYYYITKGYSIVRDPAFAVHHSHHLGLSGCIRQYKHWQKLADRFARQYGLKR